MGTPRLGQGSNQYQSRPGAPEPERVGHGEVVSALDGSVDVDAVAWVFAPDSDGAWAWAFPRHPAARDELHNLGFDSAMEAKATLGDVPEAMPVCVAGDLALGNLASVIGLPHQRIAPLIPAWLAFADPLYPQMEFENVCKKDGYGTYVEVGINGEGWRVFLDSVTVPSGVGDFEEECMVAERASLSGQPVAVEALLSHIDPDCDPSTSERFGSALSVLHSLWSSLTDDYGEFGMQEAMLVIHDQHTPLNVPSRWWR